MTRIIAIFALVGILGSAYAEIFVGERASQRALLQSPAETLSEINDGASDLSNFASNSWPHVSNTNLTSWKLYSSHEYEKAIDECVKGELIAPRDFTFYAISGSSYFALRKWQSAIEAYGKCINLKPQDEMAYAARGLALIQNEQMDQALKDLTQSERIQPTHSFVFDNLAYIYLTKSRFSEAITNIDRSIDLYRSNSRAYITRAVAYFYKSDIRKAVSDLDISFQLNPKDPELYLWRAHANCYLSKWMDTIIDDNKFLQLNPKPIEPTAFIDSGWAKYKLTNYTEALADFNQALELDQTNSGIYSSRAWINYSLENITGARNDCNAAIKLSPENSEYRVQLAFIALHEKHYQEVVSICNQALNFSSTNTSVYPIGTKDLAGSAWAKDKSNPEGSSVDFNRTNDINQTSAGIYNLRGWASYKIGNFASAREDYAAAIKLSPGHSEYWYRLAYINFDEKRYQDAVSTCNQALDLNVTNTKLYFIRSRAFERLGKFTQAINDYKSALMIDSENPIMNNNLAWLLATSPVLSLRDGELAFQLSNKACRLAGWTNGLMIGTLAAACAQCGDFEKAVNYQTRSMAMLKMEAASEKDAEAALAGYKKHLPYTDPSFVKYQNKSE